MNERYTGIIDRYRARLPLADGVNAVSLSEGNTPLIRLTRFPDQFDKPIELYVKYEGLNPTGSFKDRGMTVAVTQAVSEGSKAIICASTGNTSASAAAYAARAGVKAFVLIPEGKIALGKLAQAMTHGAMVLQIEGNFDAALEIVKAIGEELPITIVNSINPYRIEGQKTAAFEIVEALGRAPDFHLIPVGNAGNITAYWKGYTEYCNDKLTPSTPAMFGYQASGAAPFLMGHAIEDPETVATAIRIGNPQSWDGAINATTASNGHFATCTDEEILAAQKHLAQTEGIFCEPASAISIAGLIKDIDQIPANSTIVCTLTGHGLKDPNIAIEQCQAQTQRIQADISTIKQHIAEAADL